MCSFWLCTRLSIRTMSEVGNPNRVRGSIMHSALPLRLDDRSGMLRSSDSVSFSTKTQSMQHASYRHGNCTQHPLRMILCHPSYFLTHRVTECALRGSARTAQHSFFSSLRATRSARSSPPERDALEGSIDIRGRRARGPFTRGGLRVTWAEGRRCLCLRIRSSHDASCRRLARARCIPPRSRLMR